MFTTILNAILNLITYSLPVGSHAEHTSESRKAHPNELMIESLMESVSNSYGKSKSIPTGSLQSNH